MVYYNQILLTFRTMTFATTLRCLCISLKYLNPRLSWRSLSFSITLVKVVAAPRRTTFADA